MDAHADKAETRDVNGASPIFNSGERPEKRLKLDESVQKVLDEDQAGGGANF